MPHNLIANLTLPLGVSFFVCSDLIPDTLGEVSSRHFTSTFLYCWIVLSREPHVSPVEPLKMNQGNALISIQVKHRYFWGAWSPEKSNSNQNRMKIFYPCLPLLLVCQVFVFSLISWISLSGKLFKGGTMSWLYLCALTDTALEKRRVCIHPKTREYIFQKAYWCHFQSDYCLWGMPRPLYHLRECSFRYHWEFYCSKVKYISFLRYFFHIALTKSFPCHTQHRLNYVLDFLWKCRTVGSMWVPCLFPQKPNNLLQQVPGLKRADVVVCPQSKPMKSYCGIYYVSDCFLSSHRRAKGFCGLPSPITKQWQILFP